MRGDGDIQANREYVDAMLGLFINTVPVRVKVPSEIILLPWLQQIQEQQSEMLLYEHSLVKAHDLSRVNAAFFTMNGYVSVIFFLFWAADIFLHATRNR